MKQFMKNHIQIEKTSLLRDGPPCFYKDNQRD
jgi:hypothetical protein